MTDSSAGVAAETGHRVLTLPNLVTVVRLACIPVFLVLLFGSEERQAAAWLLGAVCATDWVDGFLARRLGQVSEVGKVLDPVADRLLFIVCGGAIIVDGSVPLWYGLAVFARELLFGSLLVVLTALGMKRFPVTWLGKAATFANMVAFPFFLISHSDVGWHRGARIAGWVFAVPGLILTYYAAARYLPHIRSAWRDGRAQRTHPVEV